MMPSSRFQESATALEDLVSARRRESRIAGLVRLLLRPFRVAFGLSRDYDGLNRTRDLLTDVMTPYLAGELMPDERARVDALLAAEPRCREMAAPLIAAWSVPRAREALPAAEVDAAWERFQGEVRARRAGRGEVR